MGDDRTPWLTVAHGELGQHEVAGAADNPRIVAYQRACQYPASDDETPWCAAFVGWVLKTAGYEPTGSAAARSYLTWGVDCPPKVGAVAVFQRGNSPWQGHVGFVVAVERDRLQVLGGNQSDAVSVAWMPRARLLGCRWPKEAKVNWIEKAAANVVLRKVQANMQSTGWKGKVGAVGVLLGTVAALFNDVGQGALTMDKVIGYVTAASAALSLFGIRAAVGSPPAKS